MSITVKDLLELDSLKSFHLVAGSSGLSRPIEGAGIVDWEFAEGVLVDTIKFERNSLVISSLLFAKEDQCLIYNAVESLINYGVCAMAYKDIFIKELPEEVIKLANDQKFPIFVFDAAFFEDILVEVRDAVQAADQLKAKSEALRLLLKSDLSQIDVQKTAKKINTNFMKNTLAAYLSCDEGFCDGEIIRIIENSSHNKKDIHEITISSYNNGVMIIVSANHYNSKKFKEVINELLSTTILHKTKIITSGFSKVHLWEELNHTVKEAFDACTAAKLGNKETLDYQEIGVYQFLIPNRDFESLLKFMNEYLNPILDKKNNQTKELLDTAIAFIRGGGNFKSVSEELHIHENTLRYRLSKLHKLLNPGSVEFEFYQNLTIAIKVYLIQNI